MFDQFEHYQIAIANAINIARHVNTYNCGVQE